MKRPAAMGAMVQEPPVKVAKAGTKGKMKRPAAVLDERPPIGFKCPFAYRGCKVYNYKNGYRVYPKPSESKYDKPFAYGKYESRGELWEALLDYCENPSIPADSANYVG